MALLSYAEAKGYFSLVQSDIEGSVGIKFGETGTGGEVIFKKSNFKKLINKKLSGDKLVAELKKNAKQVPNMNKRKVDPKSKSYFLSENDMPYRFSEIFKGTYSGRVTKISTPQQEQITLKIIEEVLNKKTPHYKSFEEMYNKGSELQKIFKGLDPMGDWWEHFSRQFDDIESTTNFPSSKYDVYSYTNFMSFITDIVTKKNKWYTQKDSWNPADIWLVKSGKLERYTDAIDEAVDVKEVNKILRVAYRNREIVGISLKKSGKDLQYDEVNLELVQGQQKLPNVKVSGIKLDCTYENGMFESKTSYMFVEDNNTDAYKLAFKSNTGDKKLGNITYEFLAEGAAAFLGKVPKDRLTRMIKDFVKVEGRGGAKTMPQHNRMPKRWSSRARSVWLRKVQIIETVKEFKGGMIGIDKFVANLEDSYVINGGITPNNATMMQMVEFTYILARLEQLDKLEEFATKCFYFAQKKGQKYDFGPFGKLY